MSATCRNCAHYDLEAFRLASGKLRIVKDKPARCLFDMARLIRKMPASIQPAYGGERTADSLRIAPGRMEPDEGTGCPQWTTRPPT